jgi:hypothetical protein
MKKNIFILVTIIFSSFSYSQTNLSNIIGTPLEIGNLLVAQYDIPQALTFAEAKQYCINGWRLPTKDEHQKMICPNKSKIPNLNHTKNYWSSTVSERYNVGNTVGFNVFYKLMYTDCDNGSYLNITDYDTNKLMVRLVKQK